MITTILSIVLLYLTIGLVFAIIFVFRLVDRLNEQAKGAPVGFRFIILPGSILLWPLLLRQFLKKRTS